MKHHVKHCCLIAALVVHVSAFADDRLDGMKKMNSEGCTQTVKFEEHAPKDAKQFKPYCTCVYDVYFAGFTKAEQDQLFSGSPLPDKLQKSLPVRLETAQAQCRKKIGF